MKSQNKYSSSSITILSKIKKVSLKIINKIQNNISGMQKLDSEMLEMKSKESAINIFLKISGLLCKLMLIENKITESPPEEKSEFQDIEINQSDIRLIENFLSNYNKKQIEEKNDSF